MDGIVMGNDLKGLEEFYRGRRVFVTGHTGFKGSWLCRILHDLGAEVAGYSLEPPTDPNLFEIAGISSCMSSTIGDVRDAQALRACFDAFAPEVVLHLAAQPIVREGYREPAYTYETNVMGTVNILECVRVSMDTDHPVRSFLNVTTDKVYQNREEPGYGYVEDDRLDGYDPYSNSKSCSELVTHTYARSFLSDGGVAVSTARAGNVIGGGDFASDRIIPDCIRAATSGNTIIVRNPFSTRPYQHVLEPLFAYLMIAMRQYEDHLLCGSYNVGPDLCDCVTTGDLTDLFCLSWNTRSDNGDHISWENRSDGGPHEASFLRLDCTKLKEAFSWNPRWHIADAIDMTVEWTRTWVAGGDVTACMDRQVEAYLGKRR